MKNLKKILYSNLILMFFILIFGYGIGFVILNFKMFNYQEIKIENIKLKLEKNKSLKLLELEDPDKIQKIFEIFDDYFLKEFSLFMKQFKIKNKNILNFNIEENKSIEIKLKILLDENFNKTFEGINSNIQTIIIDIQNSILNYLNYLTQREINIYEDLISQIEKSNNDKNDYETMKNLLNDKKSIGQASLMEMYLFEMFFSTRTDALMTSLKQKYFVDQLMEIQKNENFYNINIIYLDNEKDKQSMRYQIFLPILYALILLFIFIFYIYFSRGFVLRFEERK